VRYFGLGMMMTAIPAAGYFYVIEGSIFGGWFFGGLAVLGTFLYGFKETPEDAKARVDELEKLLEEVQNQR